MANTKGRVKVRGTCKAGHVTEAVSPPGRVTWKGECATDGCELVVTCRRIPGTAEADAAKASPARTPKPKTGTDDLIEVTYAEEARSERRQPANGPERRIDPNGGVQQPSGRDEQPSEGPGKPPAVSGAQGSSERSGDDGGPEPDPAPQPRGSRGRWRARFGRRGGAPSQRRAARAVVDSEWVIPGVVRR